MNDEIFVSDLEFKLVKWESVRKKTSCDGFWFLPIQISQAAVANPGSEGSEQNVGLRNEECQLCKELMWHEVKVDKPAPA